MSKKKSTGDDSKTPPVVSLLAGGIAGGIEAASTYPFEFAKTRVQLRTSLDIPTPKNPFLVISQVYRSEGLRALYAGCTSLILGSVAKDAVRFISFDSIKNGFSDPVTGTLSPLNNMLAGMSAGIVASIFAVTPTERIKTALIDDARNPDASSRAFHGSTFTAIRVIYARHGLPGLYYGLAGNTLKQASATAFRMGTYNILKDYESTHDVPQSTPTNFANGMVAGIVTTYATMPFDTIKTRSQSASGERTRDAIKGIWTDGGFRGFWRGTTMRLGRTVFSGGILFTVYERVVRLLNPLVVGVKRERRVERG